MQALQLLTFLAIALCVTDAANKLHPKLRRTLQQRPTVNVFVNFQESPRSVLESTHESAFSSRGEMITALVDRLEDLAAKSQASVAKLVAQEAAAMEGDVKPLEVTRLWITNQLYIRGATVSLIEQVAKMPEVTEIVEENRMPAPPPPHVVARNLTEATREVSWAFKQTGVLHARMLGFSGRGVVVGIIDTGIRATHEALRDNWLGAYGWFDGLASEVEPQDKHGHGTVTTSIIVGRGGIGVAPDAKWMFCRNCHESHCDFDAAHLKCMQFMTCPTDPSGNNKDCSKAPRVINNSWGSWPDNSKFDDALAVWEKAGIFAVFAAGNEGGGGTKCHSIRSPADLPYAFTVGSSGPKDVLSSFSSLGDGRAGNIKPDIVAPGENIPAAGFETDSKYVVTAGTSMSSPLVAGVVALILEANPSLTAREIRSALATTAHTEAFMSAPHKCTAGNTSGLPNNQFGYGRVNALGAITGRQHVAPGQCTGVTYFECQRTFFCTWNEAERACQRWW